MKFSHYKQNVHKSSQLSRYHVLTGLQWYCSDPSLLAGEGDMLLPGFFLFKGRFSIGQEETAEEANGEGKRLEK